MPSKRPPAHEHARCAPVCPFPGHEPLGRLARSASANAVWLEAVGIHCSAIDASLQNALPTAFSKTWKARLRSAGLAAAECSAPFEPGAGASSCRIYGRDAFASSGSEALSPSNHALGRYFNAGCAWKCETARLLHINPGQRVAVAYNFKPAGASSLAGD
jgi:hypothetical protein